MRLWIFLFLACGFRVVAGAEGLTGIIISPGREETVSSAVIAKVQSGVCDRVEENLVCSGIYSLGGVYHCMITDLTTQQGGWVRSDQGFKGMTLLGFDTESNQVLFSSSDQLIAVNMAETARLTDYIVVSQTQTALDRSPKPASDGSGVLPGFLQPRKIETLNPPGSTMTTSTDTPKMTGDPSRDTFTAILYDRVSKGYIPVKVDPAAAPRPVVEGSTQLFPRGAGSTLSPILIQNLDKDQLEGFLFEYEGIRDAVIIDGKVSR